MKFLIDAQLPPALARWIVERGHEASHVFDLGLHVADDPVIWERAQTENAILISKDQDFVDSWILSDTPVALIWIRRANCSNQALMEWLELLWPPPFEPIGTGREAYRVAGIGEARAPVLFQ